MCGVVGLVGFGKLNKKEEKIRQEVMRFLMTELLLLTLPRGKDATGLVTMMDNGGYMGLKMGIPSPDFVARFGGTEKDYDGFLEMWRNAENFAKIALGHCRKGTIGDKEDNENNHPIKVGEVIGVHNGAINNHKEIFEIGKFKRDGEVDSEAIFRLLHHYTKNGKEPFTPEIILETCKRLSGQYAVMAFSGNNPYQLAMFRDGRPVEFVLIRPLKLLVIASEKKFLDTALFKLNKQSFLFNRTDFPKLKKSDVDFLMMKDDSYAIFDLRKEVDMETKIEDLFIGDKVPRDKIWTTGSTNVKSYNTGYTGVDKTEVDATPKQAVPDDTKKTETTEATTTQNQTSADKKKKNEKQAGRLWNKTLAKFERTTITTTAQEQVNDVSGAIIDVERGEVNNKLEKDTGNKDDNDVVVVDPKDITEVDSGATGVTSTETPTEGDEAQAADIEQIEVDGGAVDIPVKAKADTKKGLEVKEVDMTQMPALAIEAAEKATEKRPKFSTEEEVIEELNLPDAKTLKALPLHSLTNRIAKVLYKLGFLAGYKFRDEQLAEEDPLEAKGVKAIRCIRTLKLINRILVNISNKATSNDIDGATSEVFGNHGIITKAEFDAVIKEGDRRGDLVLEKIRQAVENKSDR